MTILNVIYASAPSSEVLIPTLEFSNSSAGRILLAQSFENITVTTELSEELTFIESAWEVSLPNKDATGQQTLQFQICNVTGEAQRFIDDCMASGKPTSVIYREFYADDLSAPATIPIKMTLRGGSAEGVTVGIEAGYFDLLNVGWPRFRYTPEFAPGIKYFA